MPVAVLTGVLLQLGGCGGGDSPSIIEPAGPGADRVARLWWLLFWVSLAVFLLVTGLVVWAWWRRSHDRVRVHVRGGEKLVVAGGIVLPAVVLSGVYLVALRDQAFLAEPPDRTGLTVEVTGHDWWWEVRYPEYGFTTANELHIPAGEPVRLVLRSADVVHSFWVPQLMPKTDMVPGQANDTWLVAERPGTYRGQCAEYCGLQHARMAFLVIADERAEFGRWVANQRQPARQPATSLQARGRQVLEQTSCAACHTVRGTSAGGTAGPDLTHFGSRRTIGAATVPNDRGHLGGWIVDSRSIKPGNLMPPQPLEPEDLRALIAYLESLE